MSKIKKIFRSPNVMETAQNDPEVKRWLGAAFKSVGPYFKNKSVGTGLSLDEQKLLLPDYLSIEVTDRDWRKTVETEYHNFYTRVDEDGLVLETGLENDEEPLSATNRPLVLKDYLIWRHIIDHPEVAKNKVEAGRYQDKRFYIHDPEAISEENIELAQLADKAMQTYFRFKDDEIKTDQILTLMGARTENLRFEEKQLKLRELANPKHGDNEYMQKETLKRFIKIAEDKDKEIKFLIKELVGLQYLRQVGAQGYVFAETGAKVGDTTEEAVLFFTNPKNAKELNLAKAQYVTKSKRANKQDLLPKEAEVSTVS
jgi:hypothetical protein